MAVTSIPRGPAASLRRNPAAPWRHLDVALLGATLSVAVLGTIMVFSATRSVIGEADLAPTTFLVRQLLFFGAGLLVLAATLVVDYRTLRDLAPIAYVVALVLLVAVLSPLGIVVNGARSWFAVGQFQLQPAEFGKLAVIILLASYLASHRGDVDGRRLLVALVLAGVPAGLILVQPDVGSMLVYIAVVAGVLLVAGARPRHMLALVAVGTLGIVGLFQLDVLEDYQKDRFTAAFAPEGRTDRQGAGYNLDQAKTAIGAGGLTGAGLFEGTQTKLRYVPEQQTDFIFTVVGEELGFLGSATLLLLYGVIIWRIWRAAQVARDFFGTLLCTGVMSMLLFHVFENVGMTMGIMPITGIPLPFVSYGGSSLVTMFAAVGVVLNVHMRRFS